MTYTTNIIFIDQLFSEYKGSQEGLADNYTVDVHS